jgi:hypothetical protein
MENKRRERNAYHEAGHAVIGYRFGLRWGDVAIKYVKEGTGCIRRWFEVIDIQAPDAGASGRPCGDNGV